jgi:hypothetical protein
VVDAAQPAEFPRTVASLLAAPEERARLARNAWRYAQDHLTPESFARQFDAVLGEVSPSPAR